MKKITYVAGQYSQLKLDDGSKIFLEALPEKVRIKKMIWGIIPTKTIWEFSFPFYIRTAIEAWESSKNILEIVLETIQGVENLTELKNRLENETSKALQNYIKEHGEEARDISADKVGMLALKQMMNPKLLQKTEKIVHEYSKILERLGQETMQKYPALFFPESLLPYPKEVIKRALEESLRYYEDEKIRGSIKFSLGSLVAFIDDEEANKRNAEMIKNLANRKKV